MYWDWEWGLGETEMVGEEKGTRLVRVTTKLSSSESFGLGVGGNFKAVNYYIISVATREFPVGASAANGGQRRPRPGDGQVEEEKW